VKGLRKYTRLVKVKKPIFLLLLGIIFFAVYLYALKVDFRYIFARIREINLFFIPLILTVDILFILTYSVAWFLLVKIVCPEVRLKDSILIVIVGWFGDMLIPAAFMTGEALRLILLKKRYNLDMSKAAATVVIHRLLNAMAFLFFITLGLTMLSLNQSEIHSRIFYQSIVLIILSSLGLFLILLLLRKTYILRNFIKKVVKKTVIAIWRYEKYNINEKVDSFFESFESSLGIMKKYKLVIIVSFSILLFQWSLGVAIPYLFFLAIGQHVSFWTLSVAYPIYSLMDNIPLGIPANAGALDAAMISTFVVLGVSKENATLVTLLTRSVIVFFEAVLTGSLSFVYISKTFKDISLQNLRDIIAR